MDHRILKSLEELKNEFKWFKKYSDKFYFI
jgi:hypothetical protein